MKGMNKYMETRSTPSAAVSNEKIKLITKLHSHSHRNSQLRPVTIHLGKKHHGKKEELAIISDKECDMVHLNVHHKYLLTSEHFYHSPS